jgi:hypothetical protein
MKKVAIVLNTEDYTNVEIISVENREAGIAAFKAAVEDVVGTYTTRGVGYVELNDDGTGEITIDYDISGPGESYTFDVEENFFDESEEDFDTFFENWFNKQ